MPTGEIMKSVFTGVPAGAGATALSTKTWAPCPAGLTTMVGTGFAIGLTTVTDGPGGEFCASATPGRSASIEASNNFFMVVPVGGPRPMIEPGQSRQHESNTRPHRMRAGSMLDVNVRMGWAAPNRGEAQSQEFSRLRCPATRCLPAAVLAASLAPRSRQPLLMAAERNWNLCSDKSQSITLRAVCNPATLSNKYSRAGRAGRARRDMAHVPPCTPR